MIPNQFQNPRQTPQTITQDMLAVQTVNELINMKKNLGLSLTIYDSNLNTLEAKFNNITESLRNPFFISKLNQEFYVNYNEASWFKLKLRNGKFVSITFLLNLKINWVKIINKSSSSYDFIIVGYASGDNNAYVARTDIPRSDVTPEKVVKHFPQIIGQTSNSQIEIGNLICHMLSQYLTKPTYDMLMYLGFRQGFNKNVNKKIQFNPPHLLYQEMKKYMPASLTSREFPLSSEAIWNEDITPILKPMFSRQKDFQLLLLYRFSSWHQSFFAKKDVYSDNILIVKPGRKLSTAFAVAMLKNTRYDSLDASPIGPNIKPLMFELENVNDGMVVVIDIFAADQFMKAEKGFDLLIGDASGAVRNIEAVHHITALISEYADMHLPKDKCCTLEINKVATDCSVEAYKTALKRFDANLVVKTERGCDCYDFITVFKNYVDEVKSNIPDTIPYSKRNTYIMLMTALRIYNEWYTPLFCPDIEQYIVDWLCSQEQDRQSLHDIICSEYGKILNKKIAEGYFHLIPKEEVTLFDKGTHSIVVDKNKRCIYVEPADSFAIARDEMTSVADTDNLTAALYSCDYLPHNAKNEKSIRIAAITSDGTPYPLYVHAISYTLLTQENRQRFNLIDKEANLFNYNEIPEEFLPLVKTVDGRFAGKMLRYSAEEANIYFGTGKIGSGKSWAIAQLIPMLFMLEHTVVVFDVSNSYTKEKILHMLPADVGEKLFKFINVGVKKDQIPVDVGSLRDCETLPDKKRAIYSILRAATGSLDKSTSRKLKGFLSEYLNDKDYSVNFNHLCSTLKKNSDFGTSVADCVDSVLKDINEIGCKEQTWDDLFLQESKIVVINLGNEVGDNTHQLLDMLVSSLFNRQMSHDTGFLFIVIDELIDQDFSTGSPLQTIVKQGRKFHTALIGATQDYYNQGSSHLDVMKQANITSFCRPGKSEDRVAQKLGYSNAVDAGFNKFKSGDTIIEFDGYNKDTDENEALTIRGRVVNFIETPLYEKFKKAYGYSE